MRCIIYGAGAIGGALGGRLFENGVAVVLIARGTHYEALSQSGLALQSPEGTAHLPVPVVADPRDIEYGVDDVLFLTMKSQDTASALRTLATVAPASLPIVCAQNGVENERVALRSFRHVYGMYVMCPSTHVSPGVVQAHSTPTTGILDLGLWPTGVDDAASAIAATLCASSFSSETRDNIARWKWGKLLANLGNAVEAVCGVEARSGKVTELAQQEAISCFAAADIAFVPQEESTARRGSLLKPLEGGSSSWQSLQRGTGTIETDFLNGEIVLLGRLWSVPTPVNEALQRLANEMARSCKPPGSMPEDELLRLVE